MDERSPSADERPALREIPRETPENPGMALQPLAVSGLVVSMAALVAALRPYLPQLIGITPLDGEQFLLQLTGADQGQEGAAPPPRRTCRRSRT